MRSPPSPYVRTAVLGLFLPVLLLTGCVKKEPSGKQKPIVAVSILPQSYFTGRIGGERISTLVLVGPGQSPHSYEPTPRQMAELADAKVWVLSNTEFEDAIAAKVRSLCPELLIIDGTEGVLFRQMEEHEDGLEEGGLEGGAHAHGVRTGITGPGMNLDRHSWLGWDAARIMSSHILDALVSFDPGGADFYQKNYDALIADIDTAFDALKEDLASLKGSTVFVYHPSFGYFLDEFGIIQEAVETGGKEPTPRILGELIEHAREEGAAAIFVQAQFPVSSAQTVAASVGAEVISLDPLAGDWLANIQAMGTALKRAAGKGAP